MAKLKWRKIKPSQDQPASHQKDGEGDTKINNTETGAGQRIAIDLSHRLREERKAERGEDAAQDKKQLRWTIIGAGLVFVYTLISGWQAVLLRTQIRLNERAWVTIDIDHFTLEPELSATTKILNSGRTVATNVTWDATLSTKRKPDEISAYMEKLGPLPTQGSVSVIPPSVPINSTFYGETSLTPDSIEAIKNGTKPLCTFGTVKYSDIFNERHITHYCSCYGAPTGQVVDCPGWNSAD